MKTFYNQKRKKCDDNEKNPSKLAAVMLKKRMAEMESPGVLESRVAQAAVRAESQLRSYSGGPAGMGTMSLSFHSLH